MIDLDEILEMVKSYYKIVVAILALFVLYLCIWLFRGYGGRPEVREKIDEIRVTAKANERRVENIIDAARTKEEEVKKDVSEKIAAQSDDALPALLAGLLSDYRKQH